MLSERLKGTGVAMVTPFDSSGKVDHRALARLTDHLVEGGVEYLVVLGTTGESATLDKEEKKEVIATVTRQNAGRLPVVIGIGGNNTSEVIDTIGSTDLEGIDAILSVSPYYNKPTQGGIYKHYEAISKSSPRPIILYNVPTRTSSNIAPDTTLALARDFKNIIAIKEASPDITQSMRLIQHKPQDFLVISGDDALTFPFIACGGNGVISVVANVYPKQFSAMVRHALKGEVTAGRKIHYALLDIIDQLFVEGNPGGAKAALHQLEICEENLRLPLVPVGEVTRKKMKELMQQFKG